MKKNFKLYLAAWAIVLALFNVISFVVPNERTTSFWIGYILISLMFVGQFASSYSVFKAENATKAFYNLSLVRIGYIGLIASFVVGGLCMLISPLPYWVGVVVCAIVLAANILSVLKATAAVAEVERVDSKIKVQTSFTKMLTIDADTLMAQAKSDEVKTECRKVYEVIRYSDPMSNDELASVESQIRAKFAELSDAVKADDAEKVVEIATEVVILIGDRNKKCKILK
jgi:hypothetical protein